MIVGSEICQISLMGKSERYIASLQKHRVAINEWPPPGTAPPPLSTPPLFTAFFLIDDQCQFIVETSSISLVTDPLGNMVTAMKGLNVQKSRFAALSLSDDEEESEALWQEVKTKPAAAKKGSSHGDQPPGQEGKVLSKSAKKRARKRRNKSTSSDHDVRQLVGITFLVECGHQLHFIFFLSCVSVRACVCGREGGSSSRPLGLVWLC